MILQRASTQDKFTFTAKRWLAKDEGDKKTEIDINVDEPAKDGIHYYIIKDIRRVHVNIHDYQQ